METQGDGVRIKYSRPNPRGHENRSRFPYGDRFTPPGALVPGALARGASALCALILAATSCVPADRSIASARAVTDDTERIVALAAPARRVFSVIPSLTESIVLLDPGVLVARTRFDGDSAIRHLPSLGDLIQPNLEALAALEPDLVVTWAEDALGTIGDRAAALGIPVYRADVQTIDDMRSHLGRLGTLLGREARAAAVVDSLDAALARVAAGVRGREAVSLYYSLWHDPPQTTGPGTFIDEAIRLAGGRNLFADSPRPWPQVSVEAVLARDPVALVVARHSAEAAGMPWLQGPGWRDLTAVRTGRVLVVDGELFNRPGPRISQAVAQLAHFLHGGPPAGDAIRGDSMPDDSLRDDSIPGDSTSGDSIRW